ncbi:MAG: hypothetical protein RL596_683 [Bacteroidota bacterium]|jgi:uncharacterized membrane protein
MTAISNKRIESIDILRGIVMVIMALDHVRDFLHIEAFTDDPLNLTTTTPVLYFTRWITHLCAPIFVLLSGVSIYLQSLRKTKKELTSFLIKRGLWLIIIELVIISFAWTFNPNFNFVPLGVFWAIGISMLILALAIHLPFTMILILGCIIVFGHNLLDRLEAAKDFKGGFWWALLHNGKWSPYAYSPNHYLIIIYPFIPWTGLMMIGYCTGIFFTPNFTSEVRQKILLRIGCTLILLFAILRFINVYGDPVAWSQQKNGLYTFLSFMNVNKYPPSLLYLSITIGIAFILLSIIEKYKNRFTDTVSIFGRTAFFYYIVHFFIIHLFLTIVFYAQGHTTQEALDSAKNIPFLFALPGNGFSLLGIYCIWICLVIALYPLCKWYDTYKTKNKHIWWLSYL